ncbi:MAG: hypothetical protein J1F22_01550 [Lachnospiraceae bacterium]|nr:hypothetical protein [Lachnospiraceae bacterium]
MSRKKMLFWYEARTMKWFLLAGCLCALGMTAWLQIKIGASLYTDTYESFDAVCDAFYYQTGFQDQLLEILMYGNIASVFAFAFMAAIQFSDYHNRKTREFITSLPFNNRERFCMKAGMGYGVITVSCLILSVGVLLLRSRYIGMFLKQRVETKEFMLYYANEAVQNTILSLLYFWLTLLALYSVFMAVQFCFGHGVAAALTGIGAVLAPMELWWVIIRQSHVWGRAPSDLLDEIADAVRKFDETGRQIFYAFFGSGTGEIYNASDGIYTYDNMIVYEQRNVLLVVMAVIFVGCTLLAWWLGTHQDLARRGALIPYRWARIVFAVGVGICFGAAGLAFINEWCFLLVGGVTGVVAYRLSRRIVK